MKFSRICALAILAIVLTMAVTACSSAPTKPSTTPTAPPSQTPPAPPAQPTTPTTPTTPTAPAPPAPSEPAVTKPAITTSFTADTYSSTTPSFTVMYPKNWAKQDVSNPTVFAVSDVNVSTFDSIKVIVIDKAANTDEKAVRTAVDNSALLGGNPYTLDSIKTITLADGKTPGFAAELSVVTKYFKRNVYAVGANFGDKTVVVATLSSDPAKVKGILTEAANTLSSK